MNPIPAAEAAPPADRLVLPAELVPRWQDLPRLAWTLARAYTTGPAWWVVPGALASAMLLTGPYLTGLSLVGGVATLRPGQAVAVAVPDARSRRVVLAGAAAGLTACALIFVVSVSAGLGTLETLPTVPLAAFAAALGVLALAGAPVLSLIPHALRRERPAPHQPRDAVVSMVAAWPQRRGAGGQLMAELCAVADDQGITLRLTARTPDAGRLYQAHGFHYDHHGASRHMTRRPSGHPQ